MTPPALEWYEADADDADRFPVTPALGHLPGAVSDLDGRNPHEPTDAYIRRLQTELNEARAKVARAAAAADEHEAWMNSTQMAGRVGHTDFRERESHRGLVAEIRAALAAPEPDHA